MTSSQNISISSLLDAWRSHEDLRRNGAPIPELAAARQRLEDVRLQTRAMVR